MNNFDFLCVMVGLVWAHFVCDFLLQTDKVAINKSSSNKTLFIHVLIYSIPLTIFGPLFALVNAALHFVVDYVTSRATSFLWKHNKRHWFFVTIGLDQALHMTCLFVTYYLLYVG